MLFPMSLSFTNEDAHSPPTASHTREPPLFSTSPCSPNSWAISRKCCSQQEVNLLQMAGWLLLVSSQTTQTILTLLSASWRNDSGTARSPQTVYTLACNSCFQQSKYFKHLFLLPQESLPNNTSTRKQDANVHTIHVSVWCFVSISMFSSGAERFKYGSY